VQVPVITIAELCIGGLQVLHVEAMVLQFPQPLKLDGLLGMNVLKQFRMTIEVDTQTLVLRPLGRSFP
jgi:predicted aspartyl protease